MSSYLDLGDLSGIVISCPHPFRASDLCLACLHADGRLELLTGAWESILGYKRHELDGRALHTLLSRGSDAVRRLLDPAEPDPVLIDVIASGGGVRSLEVHRRLDDYEPSLYLACEPFGGRAPEISFMSRPLSFFSRP
jgi:PAS domain-containing protein